MFYVDFGEFRKRFLDQGWQEAQVCLQFVQNIVC